MTAATTNDLLPRAPGGMLPGAVLALLVHASMLLAMASVVQWRASAPEIVSAELWSALPQRAAPAPPPPAPAPAPVAPAPAPAPPPPKVEPTQPDPQIAIAQAKAEREKLERAERAERDRAAARDKAEHSRTERERLRMEREAEARHKAEAEARKQEQLARQEKADEERLAQQRQKNLDRLMGQVGTPTGSDGGTAAQSSGPSASYTGRLIAAIKPNIVFTDSISGNPAAEVEVRAGAGGSIIARRLLRSSGNKDWDEAVLRAIDRTGSLPRDVDGRVPATLIMAFRPKE